MCFFVSAKDMKHAGNILIASLGRQPENTLLHWAGAVLDRSQVSKNLSEAMRQAQFLLGETPLCPRCCWFEPIMSWLCSWTLDDFGAFMYFLIAGCVHHGQSSLVLWRGTWCCGLFEVSFVVRPPSRPYMKIR